MPVRLPARLPARWRRLLACLLLCALGGSGPAGAARILFVGNSFTFGAGSAVPGFRPDTVTDLNGEGLGGMPALVQAFFGQVGQTHQVALETRGGAGLDWHLAERRERLAAHPWDHVVLHGYSTLDRERPGDPALLVRSVRALAAWLRTAHPAVELHLLSTWARADQIYPADGAWHGRSVEAMTADLRAAYDLAAAGAPGVRGVIPVGEAWALAMRRGVADPNPYDGLAPGQLDLWATDHYHASAAGSYLEALVVFGQLSGLDPRRLGEAEPVAAALGLAPAQARALQQVAAEALGTAPRQAP